MKKYLTYKEMKELALKHYNEGGDSFYECIDEKDFNEFYSNYTEEDALLMFYHDKMIFQEYASTAW